MRSLLPCLILLMLSACGTKTPLMLPPGHSAPPLFGTAAPASTSGKPAPVSPPAATDDNKTTLEKPTP